MSLDSFENIERQHARRKERERHLGVIKHIANSAGVDGTDLVYICSATDGLTDSPSAQTSPFDATTNPKQSSSIWKQHLSKRAIILLSSLVLVVVLAATLLSGDSEQRTQATPPKGGDASHPKYNDLFSVVLDWQVTPRDVLEEPSSAAFRALQWLAFEDKIGSSNIETLRARFALATLYFSTNAAWINKNHWMSSYSVCVWHGVACFDTNEAIDLVQAINLTSNGLMGTIPKELALLKRDLRFLDLSGNSIQGDIPDLSSLENLRHLYLGPNELSGSIPESLYSNTLLTHLYLEDCKLSGSISSALGQLSNLEGLSVHNNFLSGTIPTEIASLRTLKVLYLDSNSLTGVIPTSIGSLTSVFDLRLRHNELHGSIPTEISSMRILQLLYLDGNSLTGEIPGEALANLALLREIHLYENHLESTIPSELGSLALLNTLYLDKNRLQGTIPTEVFDLHYLENLYLFDNVLTGPIPAPPAPVLSSIEKLFCNDNNLSGSFPDTLLGNLSNLKHAQFQGNHITGLVNCDGVPDSLDTLSADCFSQDMSCECCTMCYS